MEAARPPTARESASLPAAGMRGLKTIAGPRIGTWLAVDVPAGVCEDAALGERAIERRIHDVHRAAARESTEPARPSTTLPVMLIIPPEYAVTAQPPAVMWLLLMLTIQPALTTMASPSRTSSATSLSFTPSPAAQT